MPLLNLLLGLFAQQPSQPPMKRSDACRAIISGRGIQGHGGIRRNRQDIISPLKARSLANSRLVRFFGVDNAFTTADPEYRALFIKTASAKMSLSPLNWRRVGYVTELSLNSELVRGNTEIPLMELAQTTTLAVMLDTLFWDNQDTEEPVFDRDALLIVAECINELWSDSKHEDEPSPELRADLETALRVLVPGCSFHPRDTPLNWILPGYETLWRIALLTFLHVTTNLEWHREMVRFSKDAEVQGGPRALEDRTVLAFNIVREGLRLYPSTKRVYRVFHFEGDRRACPVSANVEACHRDESVWGDDAGRFVPERWGERDTHFNQAWMPFGAWPFLCPARKDFALRMIAILVGGMCWLIDLDGWEVDLGEDQRRLDEGCALPSGRFAAQDWMLRRTGDGGDVDGSDVDGGDDGGVPPLENLSLD